MWRLYQGEERAKLPREVVIRSGAPGGTPGHWTLSGPSMTFMVDRNSKNTGKQVYEKLISGMYLGELTRYYNSV